jgi:hypothetical protein
MNTQKTMDRLRLPLPAAALLAALVAAGFAPAGGRPAVERAYWYGSDRDGCRYAFNNLDGRHWTFTLTAPTGKAFSGDFTEVTRCEDFIEIKLDGPGLEVRDRLYKDKLLTLSKSGYWIEMAKGKWR